MKVTETISDLRALCAPLRQKGLKIGFVPTMGALHAGHISLIEEAKKHADIVIVSIFVNPTQFGEAADLTNYPRDDEGDLKKLSAAGVDLVFLPSVEVMYPNGDETIVETTRMANILHGLVRPGHFRGVTTVVARLFNIVQPDFACFGEKDYQQLQIIKRMVQDLAFPIEIVGVPTMREADGLAMSSRNQRLSAENRKRAVILSKALDAAGKLAIKTETTLRDCITKVIESEPNAKLCGLDIVAATSLNAPIDGKPIAVMMSVQFGEILLIDQRVYA